MRLVAPESWPAAVEQARADGFTFFDWLGVEDQIGRSDTLRVVLALRRLDRPGEMALLGVELPRAAPSLASIRGIFAGAAWHEREAAELFGVEFVGGQRGRLLLGSGFRRHPAAQGRGAGGAYGGGLAGGQGAGGERLAIPRAQCTTLDRAWCPPECRTRRCGATGTRRRLIRTRLRWPSRPVARVRAGGGRDPARVDPADRAGLHLLHDLRPGVPDLVHHDRLPLRGGAGSAAGRPAAYDACARPLRHRLVAVHVLRDLHRRVPLRRPGVGRPTYSRRSVPPRRAGRAHRPRSSACRSSGECRGCWPGAPGPKACRRCRR